MNAKLTIKNFLKVANSRSLVRLKFAEYKDGDEKSSMDAFKKDKNEIKKQTEEFQSLWDEMQAVDHHTLACALVECAPHSFSGRLEFIEKSNDWEYTAGWYLPLEIRCACWWLLYSAKIRIEETKNLK